MLLDSAVELGDNRVFEAGNVAIRHLQPVGLEVGLVAQANQVRDEPVAGIRTLKLAEQDVVRLHACRHRLEIPDVARLTKHRGVANHRKMRRIDLRQMRDDEVRKSGDQPVVLGLDRKSVV